MPDASHGPAHPSSDKGQLDVAIVGGGLAGLYAIHRLRGMGLKVRAYEAGSGVGGTWFWNRYPGARCDVESLEYSYSFSNELQQEWKWPERYGTQPEILKYINHVADRFDLRRDVQLNTRIVSALFDDKTGEWTLKTDGGEEIRARYCVMAAGNLSTPRVPDFKGLKNFKGKWYHSGLWPHEGVDFSGSARRRDRHRLVGRADDPDHRQPGQAPDGLPAHRQLQPAGAQWADGARARAAAQGRVSGAPRRGGRHAVRHRRAMPSRPGRRSMCRKTSATRPTRPSGRRAAASATSMPTPTFW